MITYSRPKCSGEHADRNNLPSLLLFWFVRAPPELHFGAGAVFDSDGRSDKAEGFANLVGKKTSRMWQNFLTAPAVSQTML
jgi:hypothetical protein